MQVFQHLRMDLARCGCTPIIGAVQGEANTRTLVVTLYDNGVAWEIPEAAVVDVAFKKPDGTQGIYSKLPDGSPATTFDGNVLTAILAPQALTCAGKVAAAFVFHKDGEKTLASFPFTITVTANPAAGAERSEDYYNPTVGDIEAEVKAVLVEVQHASEAATRAAAAATDASNFAATAEAAAEAAAASAATAATDAAAAATAGAQEVVEGLTAADVGARPDTWTPTAADVGARPDTWTPTAADVGARPNTWTPTAAEIGAAPGGFGLGEETPAMVNDCNLAIKTGVVRYATGAANAPMNSGEWLETISYSATFKYQRAFLSYYSKTIAERWMINGEWQPWEWVNPPLTPGEEYRTTERFQGKPVYVMAVSVPDIPANGSQSVSIATGTRPLRAYATGTPTTGNTTYVTSPVNNDAEGFYAWAFHTTNANLVRLHVKSICAMTDVVGVVYYTKD